MKLKVSGFGAFLWLRVPNPKNPLTSKIPFGQKSSQTKIHALFGKFLDTHCNVGQFGSFGITSGVFGDALADTEDHGGR